MKIIVQTSLLVFGFTIGWYSNTWFNQATNLAQAKNIHASAIKEQKHQQTHARTPSDTHHQQGFHQDSFIDLLFQQKYATARQQLIQGSAYITEKQQHLIGQQLGHILFKYGLGQYFKHDEFKQLLHVFEQQYHHEPLSQLVQILDNSQKNTLKALAQLDELSSYYQEQISVQQLQITEEWLLHLGFNAVHTQNHFSKTEEWLQALINRSNDPSPYYLQLAELHFKEKQYEQSLATLENYLLRASPTNASDKLYQANLKAIQQGAQQQVKLINVNGQFLVNAVINQQLRAQLLLDTGASITSIGKHFVESKALAYSDKQVRLGTAGGVIVANTIQADSVVIGTGAIRNTHLPVIDISNHYDGLLGMDFLGQYAFYIDQDQSILYLRDSF